MIGRHRLRGMCEASCGRDRVLHYTEVGEGIQANVGAGDWFPLRGLAGSRYIARKDPIYC